MGKINLNLKQLLSVMELRKETWERRRKVNKNDMCLVASIVDVKEDIETIKRALRLKKQYEKLLGE